MKNTSSAPKKPQPRQSQPAEFFATSSALSDAGAFSFALIGPGELTQETLSHLALFGVINDVARNHYQREHLIPSHPASVPLN